MPGIIDNRQVKLGEVIKEGISDDNIDRLRIGVGYFYTSGLKSLQPQLEQFIDSGGQVDVLMGNTVNRETMEELVAGYKSQRLARVRQPNHLIPEDDKRELEQELKAELKEQLLFTDPTKGNQEFIIKLAQWLSDDILRLRVYPKERFHAKAYVFEGDGEGSITRPDLAGIVGSSNLTFSGLTSNTELNAAVYTADAEALQEWYEQRWAESDDFSPELLDVINESWAAYHPDLTLADPYHVYLKALYELFKESLETTEEYLRSFQVYQDLYDFQKWAVLRGARIARSYSGAMISDVVGMGKTYVGLALLEHFYHRNHMRGRQGKMLIICPKKLVTMWERMVAKYSLHAEVLSMGMLSNEEYYETLLDEHGDAAVVLIDESHHYRNSNTNRYENINQFLPVVNETILLSATPYTKDATDVYNQLKLFHLDDITQIPINPPNLKEFTTRVEKDQANLSELLSHVMVRRTRYDIVTQYGGEDEDGRYIEMGNEKRYLPDRKLRTTDYSISDVYGVEFYHEIVDTLEDLTYARYSLGTDEYLKPEYRDKRKYQDLSTMGENLRGLLKSNFLKRLESSIFAFRETLNRTLKSYRNFNKLLDEGTVAIGEKVGELLKSEDDPDEILEAIEEMEEEELQDYDINAFYLDPLKRDLQKDIKKLKKLHQRTDSIIEEIFDDYEKDDKLRELRVLLSNLYSGDHEIFEDGDSAEKIIVFTEFGDTIQHLDEGVQWLQDQGYLTNIRFETVTSDTSNVDEIFERFAPESNEAREKIDPEDELDLLITTDVASEGLNLQDANFVINYDIHWNPLKLIQRIGRVDRLGTEHSTVYVSNFFPETVLEDELGVVDTVSQRVNEINSVLGMDGKVLTEEDQPNQTFMERIYEEDMKSIEEYERTELLSDDEVTGSVNKLRRLREKQPELLEEIKGLDGARSAIPWSKDFDGVFVLCRQGEYTSPYIVGFPEDEEPDTLPRSQEDIIQIISCDEEDEPVEVDADKFTDRYEKATDIASRTFEVDIKEREKLAETKESIDRDYVEEQLKALADQEEDEERQRTIRNVREIVHAVNAPPVLNEFKQFRNKEIEGENLLEAVRETISKYNLEESAERQKEWEEQLNEPPHILCGMYLKASND